MKPADEAERRALHEAAAWHVRLRGSATGAEAPTDVQRAWEHWHTADPAHQRAWQRVQAVNAQFSRLPHALARQTLVRRPTGDRRAVLRSLGAGLGVGAAAWMGWQGLPWQAWQATHQTATGERQNLTLPDGSLLALDTDSAVDAAFDARERLLQLHRGRILIATQSDPEGRPFSVATPQGRVLALGTRFTVQVNNDGHSQVDVLEKAVRLLPRLGDPGELRAGEQARFSEQAVQTKTAAAPFADSWQQGGLIALDMPLGQLVAALARYRPGYLGCAPEVAALKVSGAFPLDDTDRALAALVSRFPVQLRRHTAYWVRVEAKA